MVCSKAVWLYNQVFEKIRFVKLLRSNKLCFQLLSYPEPRTSQNVLNNFFLDYSGSMIIGFSSEINQIVPYILIKLRHSMLFFLIKSLNVHNKNTIKSTRKIRVQVAATLQNYRTKLDWTMGTHRKKFTLSYRPHTQISRQ